MSTKDKTKKSTKKDPKPEAKKSRLEEVLDTFNKLSSNAGNIVLLDDKSFIQDIPVIPSGILTLDYLLGVGGYPHGRIVELYGAESSGKTTICLHAMASCQQNGGIGAFIDAEHALDVRYANNLGVNTSKLLISQPNSGEEALNAVQHLSQLLGHGDLIVIDSVAALTPQAELDGEMGDSHMGLHARLMSQALRKITAIVAKTGVTVIFVNQTRMKIGVMYGSPITTTGGNALKFYATQRLEIKRGKVIKKGDDPIGCALTIKIAKNKVAPPFREGRLEMRFGQGIPKALECLILGTEHGFIEKNGAFYNFNGQSIGQGTENAYQTLVNSPDAVAYIDTELRKRLFAKV